MACYVIDTSEILEFFICDESSEPIDISTLNDLKIKVFQDCIPFDQFKLVGDAEYKEIEVVDAAQGHVRCYMNAEQTIDGVVGQPIYWEAQTEVVNTNFTSGIQTKSTAPIELATLVKSNIIG